SVLALLTEIERHALLVDRILGASADVVAQLVDVNRVGVEGQRLSVALCRLALGETVAGRTSAKAERHLVAVALFGLFLDVDDGVVVIAHKRSDIERVALSLGKKLAPQLDRV